jgi:hypothetical protein
MSRSELGPGDNQGLVRLVTYCRATIYAWTDSVWTKHGNRFATVWTAAPRLTHTFPPFDHIPP